MRPELQLNRRHFLKAGLAAAATFLPTACASLPPPPETEPDPSLTERLLLITDVHLGPGFQPRQANALAESALETMLSQLDPASFTLRFQFGDMIRDVTDHATNQDSLERNLKALLDFTHLLGNHDLWGLTLAEIEAVFTQLSLEPEFYGHRQLTHYQVAWLDLETPNFQHGRLPLERLDWLRATIDPRQPLLLFSHYGFHPLDLPGNYYFHDHPEHTAFSNGPQAYQLLKDLPLVAVISGHLHQGHYFTRDGTHFISLPSFTENIASPDPINPGIYSVLDLSDGQLTLRSYSQGYPFFQQQFAL